MKGKKEGINSLIGLWKAFKIYLEPPNLWKEKLAHLIINLPCSASVFALH